MTTPKAATRRQCTGQIPLGPPGAFRPCERTVSRHTKTGLCQYCANNRPRRVGGVERWGNFAIEPSGEKLPW